MTTININRSRFILYATALLLIAFLYACGETALINNKCAKGKFDNVTGLSFVDNKTVCKKDNNGDGTGDGTGGGTGDGGGTTNPPATGDGGGTGGGTGDGGGTTNPPATGDNIDLAVQNPDGTIKAELIEPLPKVVKYGYSLLDNDEKKVYDLMTTALLNHEENGSYGYEEGATGKVERHHKMYISLKAHGIKIKYFNNGTSLKANNYLLTKIYNHMFQDEQRFYYAMQTPNFNTKQIWLDNGVHYLDNISVEFMGKITNKMFATDLKKIKERTDMILSYVKQGMTNEEKIKVIHDEYLRVVKAGASQSPSAGRLDGPLIYGEAICDGYSRGLSYLFQLAGFESVYVNGRNGAEGTPKNTWAPHAWVKVKLNGEWYNIDPLGNEPSGVQQPGDPDVIYRAYLLNDTDMSKQYLEESSYSYKDDFRVVVDVPLPKATARSFPRPPDLPQRK